MKFRSQLCQTGIKKLVESGKGFPFDPGTGKPMKDRVLIPQSKKDNWISICEESKFYSLS